MDRHHSIGTELWKNDDPEEKKLLLKQKELIPRPRRSEGLEGGKRRQIRLTESRLLRHPWPREGRKQKGRKEVKKHRR